MMTENCIMSDRRLSQLRAVLWKKKKFSNFQKESFFKTRLRILVVGNGCGGDHRDDTEILLLCQFWLLEMLHSHMMESAKLQTLLSGLMKSDCTYRREEGRYIRWQRERGGAGWVLEGEHSCIPELSIILFIFILYDECKVERIQAGSFYYLARVGKNYVEKNLQHFLKVIIVHVESLPILLHTPKP